MQSTNCTCTVAGMEEILIFSREQPWEQPRFAYITKKSNLHDERLSHDLSNDSWQNKQSRGKYRFEPTWDTLLQLCRRHFASCHCPLSLQQNTIWVRGRGSQQVCIETSGKYADKLQMYPPLLSTNTSTFTLRWRRNSKFRSNRADNHNQAGFGWKNEWKLRWWRSKKRNNWKMWLAWR